MAYADTGYYSADVLTVDSVNEHRSYSKMVYNDCGAVIPVGRVLVVSENSDADMTYLRYPLADGAVVSHLTRIESKDEYGGVSAYVMTPGEEYFLPVISLVGSPAVGDELIAQQDTGKLKAKAAATDFVVCRLLSEPDTTDDTSFVRIQTILSQTPTV